MTNWDKFDVDGELARVDMVAEYEALQMEYGKFLDNAMGYCKETLAFAAESVKSTSSRRQLAKLKAKRTQRNRAKAANAANAVAETVSAARNAEPGKDKVPESALLIDDMLKRLANTIAEVGNAHDECERCRNFSRQYDRIAEQKDAYRAAVGLIKHLNEFKRHLCTNEEQAFVDDDTELIALWRSCSKAVKNCIHLLTSTASHVALLSSLKLNLNGPAAEFARHALKCHADSARIMAMRPPRVSVKGEANAKEAKLDNDSASIGANEAAEKELSKKVEAILWLARSLAFAGLGHTYLAATHARQAERIYREINESSAAKYVQGNQGNGLPPTGKDALDTYLDHMTGQRQPNGDAASATIANYTGPLCTFPGLLNIVRYLNDMEKHDSKGMADDVSYYTEAIQTEIQMAKGCSSSSCCQSSSASKLVNSFRGHLVRIAFAGGESVRDGHGHVFGKVLSERQRVRSRIRLFSRTSSDESKVNGSCSRIQASNDDLHIDEQSGSQEVVDETDTSLSPDPRDDMPCAPRADDDASRIDFGKCMADAVQLFYEAQILSEEQFHRSADVKYCAAASILLQCHPILFGSKTNSAQADQNYVPNSKLVYARRIFIACLVNAAISRALTPYGLKLGHDTTKKEVAAKNSLHESSSSSSSSSSSQDNERESDGSVHGALRNLSAKSMASIEPSKLINIAITVCCTVGSADGKPFTVCDELVLRMKKCYVFERQRMVRKWDEELDSISVVIDAHTGTGLGLGLGLAETLPAEPLASFTYCEDDTTTGFAQQHFMGVLDILHDDSDCLTTDSARLPHMDANVQMEKRSSGCPTRAQFLESCRQKINHDKYRIDYWKKTYSTW